MLLIPSNQSADKIAKIKELKNGRDQSIGDSQKENIIDQSILIVDITFIVDIDYNWYQDYIRYLSHGCFEGQTDFSTCPCHVLLIKSQFLY